MGLVHAGLVVDEDGGEDAIGDRPSLDDLGGGRLAENGPDGLYQVLADDLVLLSGDAKGDVPVGDALDGTRELEASRRCEVA